jgi:hypothetical protein
MSLGNTYSYPDRNEQTLTMRPAHGAVLLFDSDDRYQLDKDQQVNNLSAINPNNFNINRQKLFGAGAIKRYALTEISFPWTTPNVVTNGNTPNNKLLMLLNNGSGGVVDTPVYVPILIEDYYTPAELATALQTQLNDAGATGGFYLFADNTHLGKEGTWTVSFNSRNQFVLTETTNTYQFIVLTNNEYYDFFSPYPIKTLNQTMGFNYGGSAPAQAYTQSSGIPSMSYTRYIDIVSQTMSKYQNTKDAQTQYNYADVIYRLILDNNNGLNSQNGETNYFGSYPCVNLYRQIQNPKFIQWTGDEFLNSIDIKLYDDAGQPLYIPTKNWGSNFLLTFLMLDS